MNERPEFAAPAILAEPGCDPALPGALEADLRRLVSERGRQGHALLPALRRMRDTLGPLGDEALRAAAPLLGVRAADLKELALASGGFALAGPPAHEVVVCVHRHCRARGALDLLRVTEEETGATLGRVAPGGGVRLDTALCLGACKLGPNVLVNGACWHAVTPSGLRRIVRSLAPDRLPSSFRRSFE